MQIRLDKFLADAGVGTRSEVKKKLKTERVLVNGQPAGDPGLRLDPEKDAVTLNGKRVERRLFSYYMLYKPAGVVSASRDPKEKTVADLVPHKGREALFPVGRLDKDTTGLMLITNDGELAHRLLSPAHHVVKEYLVTYRAICRSREKEEEYGEGRYPALTKEAIRTLRQGVDIGDEKPTLPAEVQLLPDEEAENAAEGAGTAGQDHRCLIRITEGRYHQVKRMFRAVGYKVTALKRLAMGPLRLDESLAPGEYRELDPSSGVFSELLQAAKQL